MSAGENERDLQRWRAAYDRAQVDPTFPPPMPKQERSGESHEGAWDREAIRTEILAYFRNEQERQVIERIMDQIREDLSGRLQLGLLAQRRGRIFENFENERTDWRRVKYDLEFDSSFVKHDRYIHSLHVAREFLRLCEHFGLDPGNPSELRHIFYGTVACLIHDDRYQLRPMSHAFDGLIKSIVETSREDLFTTRQLIKLGFAKKSKGKVVPLTHDDELIESVRNKRSPLSKIFNDYRGFDKRYLVSLLEGKGAIGELVDLADKAYLELDAIQIGLTPPDAVEKLARFFYLDKSRLELGLQYNPQVEQEIARAAVMNFLNYKSAMYALFYHDPITLVLETAQMQCMGEALLNLLRWGKTLIKFDEEKEVIITLNEFLRLSDMEVKKILWEYAQYHQLFSGLSLRGFVNPRTLILPRFSKWKEISPKIKKFHEAKMEILWKLEKLVDWESVDDRDQAWVRLEQQAEAEALRTISLTRQELDLELYQWGKAAELEFDFVLLDLTKTKPSKMKVHNPSTGQKEVVESNLDWRRLNSLFGNSVWVYDQGPLDVEREFTRAQEEKREPRFSLVDIFRLYVDLVEGRLGGIFKIEYRLASVIQIKHGLRARATQRTPALLAEIDEQRSLAKSQSDEWWRNRCGGDYTGLRKIMLDVWMDSFRPDEDPSGSWRELEY